MTPASASKEATRQHPLNRRLSFGRADLSLTIAVVIWGVNFAVVKQTLTEITPLAFAGLRFSLAALLLVVILRLKGQDLRLKRNELWKILILGVVGVAGCQVFFTLGIAQTTASNASLIMATTPIFVILFSALLRIERVTPFMGLGVALSTLGTGLLVGVGSGEISFTSQAFAGNILVLGGTICWAVYTTLAKPLLGHYSPLKVTTLATTTAGVVLLLLASGELVRLEWADISLQGWLGLCYSFALSSAVTYAIWTSSIQKAGNTRTAVFMNVIPIVAVIASWLLLGEVLGAWQVVGAMITLTGVTLTRVPPKALI